MSLNFKFLNLYKNPNLRDYIARVVVDDRVCNFQIFSNANIRFNPFVGDEFLELSVLDGFDLPFNGYKPSLEVFGLDYESVKYEKRFKKVFYEFITDVCSEKT